MPRTPLSGTGAAPSSFTRTEISQHYRNGRLIVKARPGVSPAAVQAAEAALGLQVERTFRSLPGIRVLRFGAGVTVKAMAARLMATGLYQYAEPDRILKADTVPDDPYFSQQWSLNNTGQTGGTPGADIKAEAGWTIQSTAPNVLVAVIDSGIRVTHEDLAANIWKNPDAGNDGYTGDVNGINATFPSTEPGNGNPNDDFFHGTMVAGIIGAVGNNALGIAGIDWSVQLMALKFIASDGFGGESGELECIDFAITHNAQIINGSFGSNEGSEAEYDAIQQAGLAGIIVVVAAGNDGINADAGYAYPAGYLLDNIVTVAATSETDTLSSYSDYGSGTVDLAAPGDDIVTTFNTDDSAYASGSGTSFAAPHVVGVLALLKAHFPSDTYRQLINRLLSSVDKLPALSGQVQTGGRLDMAAALGTTSNTPFNDDFANRATLTGSIIQVRSSNVGATTETGEATTLGGATVGASLWWTWTAPSSGTFYFDTVGSAFATVEGVFTGTSVSGLTLVGADAGSGAGASHLAIQASAGQAYQIEVAGSAGATGLVGLRIVAPPPNDNFANAQVVSADPATGTFAIRGVTLYGTTEPGEPNPTGVAGGNSVWYKWTAPASGPYQLAAYSDTLDMVAAIYTGNSVAGLTLVGANNNESGTNTDSLVTFTATAGQTYDIQVDNVGAPGGNFTVSMNNAAWEFPTGGGVTTTPAVGADGTLYLGSTDGNLYAINPDGSTKWAFVSTAYFDNSSPALEPDGTVIDAAADGTVYAINPATGAQVWTFSAATEITTSPALGRDGTIYVHDDLSLYALTAAGAQKWAVTMNGHTYSSPVVGTNGTIYVGTPTGLLLFDGNGNSLGTVATTTPVDATPAIDADGTVYVPTVGNDIYALNPDGSIKWHVVPQQSDALTSSPVILPNGVIAMASDFGTLYEVSAATGSTVATITLPNGNDLSAPVAASDGTIYVATNDYNVYAVSPAGQVSIVGSTPNYVFGSLLLANGYLYFGDFDAKLYAFKVGKYAAVTPWPMFHQNPRLTGLASAATVSVASSTPSETVVAGSPLVLNVTATGGVAGGPYTPVTYQWYVNGTAIPGATAPSYEVASAAAGNSGSYSLTITSPAGTVTSPATSVLVAAPVPSKLVNLSARAAVGSGDSILIAGFVISGAGPKNILVRGVGPTLAEFGITDFLANPLLTIDNSASQTLFTDHAWGGGAALTGTFSQVGAFALPAGSADSALVESFSPGAYTALVSGPSGTGVALAEIYDADPNPLTSAAELKNLSVRAPVGTGSGVLIAGFVISGNEPKTVLIRGIGPALAGFGVAGALQAPVLSLYNSSSVQIETNSAWGGEPVLAAAMAEAGAFALSPGSGDTALLVTLPPGAYTAQVSGANSTTGVGLIEVYEVP